MICRLCKEDRSLRKSHIIPEFFYQPIYDSKHRLPLYKSGKLIEGRPLKKGIREKLLCECCEQKLSRNEKYMREVVFGGTEIDSQKVQARLVLSNLDYTKVRLFFLSLIWRMSVASEDPMWKNVNLGPHEEPIRQMVHSENAGEPWEYGFWCIIPLFNGKIGVDWIVEPERVRIDWGRGSAYWLVIGGCVYVFHITKQRLPEPVSERLIKKDGSWIISIEDAHQIAFIRQEAGQIFEAMKSEA